MGNLINKIENLYNNMDSLSLENIKSEIYKISYEIQDFRFTEEGRKVDYQLTKLWAIMSIDIYSKTYTEIKCHILKIKHIAEFINIL